jgi:acetolactate synthase-1/2/3 large subunit
LSEAARGDEIVSADVGQNQMWVGQSFRFRGDQRALLSGGMGAMGFALPAGIGACLASGGRRTIVIAGDGGFQINIQELQTVAHYRIPIKMVVMNNHALGMVRQFQEIYFHQRYQSTVKGYSVPDFIKVAAAYDIPAAKFEPAGDWKAQFRSFLESDGPSLLEVEIPAESHVNPKLLVNRPIEDMYPFLDREEFLEEMIVEPLKEKG